jgi:hypothetical protein
MEMRTATSGARRVGGDGESICRCQQADWRPARVGLPLRFRVVCVAISIAAGLIAAVLTAHSPI